MNRPAHRRSEHGGILGSLITLLCVALLCAILYLARHPIMRFAAETWIIDEPASRADAVIVLGDDNFYADRATRAAELSRQQIAPVVVASGRRIRPNAGIAELIEHDLIERGVPKEKIIRFTHDADGTKEEAVSLANLATERHWKSVVVVTSNYHARRTRYIFERVFPATVSVASARDADFDPQRWWEKRKSVKLFVRELAGMVVALWELHGAEKKDAPASDARNRPEPRMGLECGPNRHIWAKKFACPLLPISALLS